MMKLMLPVPGQELRQLLFPTMPESQQGENFTLFFFFCYEWKLPSDGRG